MKMSMHNNLKFERSGCWRCVYGSDCDKCCNAILSPQLIFLIMVLFVFFFTFFLVLSGSWWSCNLSHAVFSNDSHFLLSLLSTQSSVNSTLQTTIHSWWWWIKILWMMTPVKMGSILIFHWEMQIMKEKSQTDATNATMPVLTRAIWGDIWKHTGGKSETNETSVACFQ